MPSLLVFKRVYKLEIQSVILVFSTPLVKYCLSNLLTGSPGIYTFGNMGGDRVVWRTYSGVIHCVFGQILNLQNCFTNRNKNQEGEGASDR
jgi:hypothetical protein